VRSDSPDGTVTAASAMTSPANHGAVSVCQRLRDGREVFIRPIVPEDATELGNAISTAAPDTLHRRFIGGSPRVTPELLRRWAAA
jgi:hypothetical protein